MTKEEARRIVAARLDELSDEKHALHSHTVLENIHILLGSVMRDAGDTNVLLYTALSRWREVPLASLEKRYQETSFDYLAARKEAILPRKEYDVIFVPLYGFTSKGYRLGHGGGWYDRFLAAQPRAFKIGVGLEAGRIDFRTDPHDIPVDALVTEDQYEILRKRKRR